MSQIPLAFKVSLATVIFAGTASVTYRAALPRPRAGTPGAARAPVAAAPVRLPAPVTGRQEPAPRLDPADYTGYAEIQSGGSRAPTETLHQEKSAAPAPARSPASRPAAPARVTQQRPATHGPLKSREVGEAYPPERPLTPDPEPASSADDPVGRCVVCGSPADSWVEQEGSRRGYCRRHMAAVERPSPPAPPAAPASSAEPKPPASATAESATGDPDKRAAQCRGITQSGQRCRRKTTDPGGFCYQHRAQAGG